LAEQLPTAAGDLSYYPFSVTVAVGEVADDVVRDGVGEVADGIVGDAAGGDHVGAAVRDGVGADASVGEGVGAAVGDGEWVGGEGIGGYQGLADGAGGVVRGSETGAVWRFATAAWNGVGVRFGDGAGAKIVTLCSQSVAPPRPSIKGVHPVDVGY
jgi:hypothetical protein